MYRQGDLLIVKEATDRSHWLRPVPDGIVELGEATGHAHRLVGGEVFDHYSTKIIVSDGAAELVHEEHETITLPEGQYRVVRQRQFEGEDQWSNVVD